MAEGGVGGGMRGLANRAVSVRSLAGVIDRAREAWNGVTGGWFSPGEPITPVVAEAQPRQFQIAIGSNLIMAPRGESYQSTSFEQLRYFAANYDTAAMVIRRLIQQMQGLEWRIVAKDAEDPFVDDRRYASDIKFVTEFLRRPDKVRPWRTWLGRFLYDRLSIDAATIFPWPARDGSTYAFRIIDGATVKPLIDYQGEIPEPPAPAYAQTLWGRFTGMWTRDQLLYFPGNQQTNTPYGMSELEQVLLKINTALRKQTLDLGHWTDGNIPRALMAAPPEWSASQIERWNEWFDNWMAGDPARRQKMVLIPGAGRTGGVPVKEFAEFIADPSYDVYLSTAIISAYYQSPQTFGMLQDANRANSESQIAITQRDALEPFTGWHEDVMAFLIGNYLQCPHLRLQYVFPDDRSDFEKAQTFGIYIDKNVMQIDEVREAQGLLPLGIKPFIQINGQVYSVEAFNAMIDMTPADRAVAATAGQAAIAAQQGTPSRPGAPQGDDDDDTSEDAQPTDGNGASESQAASLDSGAADSVSKAVLKALQPPCCDRPVLFITPEIAKAETGSGGIGDYGGVDIDWHQTLTDGLKSPALGEPRPGALDALRAFRAAGLTVYLSCGGIGDPESGEALKLRMRQWLIDRGFDPDDGFVFRPKPRTLAVIDDRAICSADGADWPSITQQVMDRKAAMEGKQAVEKAARDARRALYRAARDDIRRWKTATKAALKDGKLPRAFVSETIPRPLLDAVTKELDDLSAVEHLRRWPVAQATFVKAVRVLDESERGLE